MRKKKTMTMMQWVRARKKAILAERKRPFVGWALDLGNGELSCIVHYGEKGHASVLKEIKCAKACGEPKPNYIKLNITRVMQKHGGR